jgi:hypothetical protein
MTLSIATPQQSIAVRADSKNSPEPKQVVIPGTLQSKLGCSGDWQPDCEKTALVYNKDTDIWTAEFQIPAGKYEYKVALNGSWDENYGLKAEPGGANIPLVVPQDMKVRFVYDHKTHWVTDGVNSLIVTVPGSYQSKVGCGGDFKTDCLAVWLQDPKGTGLYTGTTDKIPAGDYEAKAAVNMTDTYGQDGKPDGANLKFSVPADGTPMIFTFDPKTHILKIEIGAKGDLTLAQAQWISKDTIAWKLDKPSADYTYRLHYEPSGAMKLDSTGIMGGQNVMLTYDPTGLSADQLTVTPQLKDYALFKIGADDLAKVPDILKGQVAVSMSDSKGHLLDATSVQTWGALDDLYAYAGPLGVTWANGVPTLSLWAPTAKNVALRLFDDAKSSTSPKSVKMTNDPKTGVWSVTGDTTWKNKFYLYEVQVYVRSVNSVRLNLVTDPYSISLSANSQRSQIVDLTDPALMPDGWVDMKKPGLKSATDIVLYELHIRDFSIFDQTVPETERGTYLAFSELNSNGMKHLKALADAGLTHVHLLPAFDYATVQEVQDKRLEPDYDALKALPPNSDKQQAMIAQTADQDGFN